MPPCEPARLGAAHCADLPFFPGTIDAYPASPMLGDPATEARSLGRTFSRGCGLHRHGPARRIPVVPIRALKPGDHPAFQGQ